MRRNHLSESGMLEASNVSPFAMLKCRMVHVYENLFDKRGMDWMTAATELL